MAYLHLTLEERYQIYAFRKAGQSLRGIAGILGRAPSTVSRELRRNHGRRGYRPAKAHSIATHRALLARRRVRIQSTQWRGIESLLRKDWSPQQIAERARLEDTLRISHEWIYRHIYADKSAGGNLWRHLRCQKRKRRRYGAGRQKRTNIRARVGIECRPEHVENREELGHWEGDTIVGKHHRGAALTLVERTSRYLRIGYLPETSARTTAQIAFNRLQRFSRRVRSITLDNGCEFALHARIARSLNTRIYFADPYSPWQRGSSENTNGLVRQYLPKSNPIVGLADRDIVRIESRLNHRPRKCLGFLTPHEVFNNTRVELTVALRD